MSAATRRPPSGLAAGPARHEVWFSPAAAKDSARRPTLARGGAHRGPPMTAPRRTCLALVVLLAAALPPPLQAQRTQKPPLHARHWLAITGKPLAATAGAIMFQK